MTTPKKLQKAAYQAAITSLERGNDFLDNDQHARALEEYHRALKWVPNPHEGYEIAHEIYAAIGDAHWFEEDFDQALKNFETAQRIYGGIHSHYQPFLMLRLGQVLYRIAERDDDADTKKRAHTMLSGAYESSGEEIFDDEDPEFMEFATSGG